MIPAPSRHEIEDAFLRACHAELAALKPGNVHIHAAGHGMQIEHFQRAAAAAAPHIADPNLSIGDRILRATEASVAATGVNTNLGIVLLCAPLAMAASQVDLSTGLRRRLAAILAGLTIDDAVKAFAAIRIANPAGLGKTDDADVNNTHTDVTLIQAMHIAQDRDRIANAYITAYADIFDFALPVLREARAHATDEALAVTTLHMSLLAEFADSHIARKFGNEVAISVQNEARQLQAAWHPVATCKSLTLLHNFDASLKQRGLNPGTTADFVVATLFTALLSRHKVA